MKRFMLGPLAALSALLALPAIASATPAHLSPAPEFFSVAGAASEFARKSGGSFTLSSTTGSGEFENSTTGTLELTFQGKCGFQTTPLPFHLIMLDTDIPGILLTPGSSEHFGTSCYIFKGNGLLGTITSPNCGSDSNTMLVRFSGSVGEQDHLIYTEDEYFLETAFTIFGMPAGSSPTSINAEIVISLEGSTRKLICTH